MKNRTKNLQCQTTSQQITAPLHVLKDDNNNNNNNNNNNYYYYYYQYYYYYYYRTYNKIIDPDWFSAHLFAT